MVLDHILYEIKLNWNEKKNEKKTKTNNEQKICSNIHSTIIGLNVYLCLMQIKKSRFHNKITSFILCQTMGYINFIIFLFHYTRDIDFWVFNPVIMIQQFFFIFFFFIKVGSRKRFHISCIITEIIIYKIWNMYDSLFLCKL